MSDDFRKIGTEDELKEKILSSVSQAFTGEETNRWMVAMQEESVSKAEEPVVTGSSDNKLNENMASIVDRLFDNFKRYAFEFNRSLEHREHVVNCERPSSMRSQADYSDMGQPIRICFGHISSRDWALLVQAEENRVRVYITPIKFLVGFRPDQTDFEPYVELLLVRDRVGNSRQMIWTISGQALALESIPALSRRFFGQLVKVTRGEASNTEQFVFDPHDLNSGPSEVAVERSYEPDDKAMFFSEKPRPAEQFRQAVVDRPGHTLAQLANVGQSHGQAVTPQSGPNAPIHAARSSSSDLMGQPQYQQPQQQENNYAPAVISPGQGNSVRQFSNPAALPRQMTIPTATPVPAVDGPMPVKAEPAAPTEREELSFFSKAVQEPKQDSIKPTLAAERKESPASAPVTSVAPAIVQDIIAPEVLKVVEKIQPQVAEVVQKPEPEVKTAPALELKVEEKVAEPVKVANQDKVSERAADRVTATAAAIASQATTQTLSNAGVNGEKSSYHFVARPDEVTQKIDLNTDRDIAENNRKVAHAIKNLFDSVDSSISTLTAVGVDAMKADDIAAVGSIMRQTKTLKVLRDGIVQLSKDWQKSLEN